MATASQNASAQPLGHLHYGGSINKQTGALGPKPQLGRTFRQQKRLELMVRLENAGIGVGAAAAMLGISVNRFNYLKKSPDYLNARLKITHGIIVDYDTQLQVVKEQRKDILTSMLPPALQVIANELNAPAVTLAERKHKASVALELMDREGTFAKVSRTEIKPVDHFEFEEADKASRSIIDAIRGAAAPVTFSERSGERAARHNLATEPRAVGAASTESTHTIEAVEANEAFSNSHTLSQTDQQLALAKLEEEAAELGIHLASRNTSKEEGEDV